LTLLQQLKDSGQTNLYIGGEWRESSDGQPIDVLDPATGEPIAAVASASGDDAKAAVDAAAAAGPAFAATSPQERAELLRTAFEMLIARSDEVAHLIVAEMGKALGEAQAEAKYAAEFFRWFSGEAVRSLGNISMAPNGDKRIIAIQQPIGVSLLITPWNFPAAMATRKIAPAIAAGCTMILKPASDTPLTALAIAGILEEAGLPKGVLNVIPSRRSSTVVPVMMDDDRVRMLSFTGSTPVGRLLLEQAAGTVMKTGMELGGNAPFLVFEDADIDAAVEGVMVAKMRNGGQSCLAANRIYVHEAVADDFSQTFTRAMSSLRTGPGLEPGTDLGPVINEGAVKDMADTVDAATAAGSKIATGGARLDRPGYFFPPTVLTGVAADSPILDTEVFGPVAPVVTFSSEAEAIEMANSTIYGLASYLYTGDLARGMRVAEAIEAGMVGINRGLVSDPAAPFGGVKQSGLGREGAHEGMLEFQETKYIAASW
jgi:succinate-semialdehyde dehydrogenase/glutarate-semialdehyde dehydrogenase